MVGTQTPPQEKSARLTQRVTLYGISWQTYTRILAELGDHRASRLAYAQGVLEITMPSDRHETYKKLLERMIETLTEELNLPAKSFGATTLNRADPIVFGTNFASRAFRKSLISYTACRR